MVRAVSPETLISPGHSIFQIAPKMAGSVSVTCTQLEKGGNAPYKIHLLILGRDVAAYHEVL